MKKYYIQTVGDQSGEWIKLGEQDTVTFSVIHARLLAKELSREVRVIVFDTNEVVYTSSQETPKPDRVGFINEAVEPLNPHQ